MLIDHVDLTSNWPYGCELDVKNQNECVKVGLGFSLKGHMDMVLL